MSVNNDLTQEVVAIFIRSTNGSFLMQLRDNKSSIIYPGYWGLFGGSIEKGESVCQSASRELQEEIGIFVAPENIIKLQRYMQKDYQVHTCFYELKVPLSELNQMEGADLDLFSKKEILTGKLFSRKFNTHFDVADPLLEYFKEV